MTHCPRCGKTNPAEIHTCTPPLALQLADWHKAMADEPKRNEAKRDKHRRTETELRRLYIEAQTLRSCLFQMQEAANWSIAKQEDDEALLRQALEALEFIPASGSMLGAQAEAKRVQAIAAINERLK